VRSRGTGGVKVLTDATALLEQVVAREPNYAPAWALLAQAYALTPVYLTAFVSGATDELRRAQDASRPKAEAAARRAIQLDAKFSDGYLSLGLALGRKWLLAEELYTEALALDSNNPEALNQYGDLLAAVGHLKEALSVRKRLLSLEPFVPVFNRNTAIILWLNGQTDAAIAMLKDLPSDYAERGSYLGQVYAASGRFGDAADAIMQIPAKTFLPGSVDEAVRLLRMAPTTVTSPQSVPQLGLLGFIHVYIGDPIGMLEYYERNLDAGLLGTATTSSLWASAYGSVRQTERFKTFARKAGFVDYWRARGWPGLCRPVGADDFTCD
jgi:predicted Zn-dependent protease